MTANPKIPAQFPSITVPLVDASGNMTTAWYNSLFLPIYNRTGGASGVSTTTITTQITAVTAISNAAQTAADNALNQVETAEASIAVINSELAAVEALASNANSTATAAIGNALLKTSNLGDLTSAATARSNLGVGVFPLMVNFDTVPSGLVRYYPVTRNYNILPNFGGSASWCGVFPTANAIFSIGLIRLSVPTPIGTCTLINGGPTSVFAGVGINLLAGDVLTVRCPAFADATLAMVGINLALTLA